VVAAAPRRLSRRHFDLVSHWRLRASPQQVWAALTDTGHWPLWWPHVRRVQTLVAGGADGVGCVRRIDWSTRLPYRITIDVEAIESLPPERLRGRSSGALSGEGIWLLRADGAHTDVTYLWRVELQQGWMRALAPLLAPLFRWNHHGVMRAGGIGLARYLAGQPIRP
jgi:Polyketide cyclase / dehydrase and lipid transport